MGEVHYINRYELPTFQSVILAGVYDVKMMNELEDYPKLENMLQLLLFCGKSIPYSPDDRNQFIKNGTLDMERILEKFAIHFNDLYGDWSEHFIEDDGRRYFLLYLRPIINGTGNYYVEAQTRNKERTDVIVDYKGERFVIELKIWRGNAYNERGEKQLSDYLTYYHLKKGYMLSFCFNKNKKIGITHVNLGDCTLVEAVV